MNSSLRQTSTLLHCQWLCARATVVKALRRSRLVVGIMLFFLVAYQIVGTVLFSHGLGYIAQVPAIGQMLLERIFYLIFLLFFLMLIFSNCILLFVGAYRNRQTAWLISLPVQPEALFAGRLAESIAFSSWGLVILSAPLLVSYGRLFDAQAWFYLASFSLILVFIVIPAALAALVVLWTTSYWPKGISAILPVAIALIGLLVWNLSSTAPQDIIEGDVASAQFAIADYLKHTEISTHPALPCSWVSDSILGWLGLHEGGNGCFHFFLTASQAMMLLLVTGFVARRLYLRGWSRNARRRSRSGLTACDALRNDQRLLLKPGPARKAMAIALKDLLTFLRDPAQWIQGLIITGLLVIYILNLGNMGYDFDNPFWHRVITYLNLTVCSLALSTLTTRFVFPQFSFEGRRLWILGVAPFSLSGLLWLKFGLAVCITGITSIGLMLLSAHILELPLHQGAYFSLTLFLLCVGLCALSTGLGTLFPNFQESNPAKMVSGFGGTLCLIASFILIVAVISIAALPEVVRLHATAHEMAFRNAHALGAIGILVIATSLGVLIPATRKVKKLDFFDIP